MLRPERSAGFASGDFRDRDVLRNPVADFVVGQNGAAMAIPEGVMAHGLWFIEEKKQTIEHRLFVIIARRTAMPASRGAQQAKDQQPCCQIRTPVVRPSRHSAPRQSLLEF